MPINFLNDVELTGGLKINNSSGNLNLDKNEIQNAKVQNLGTLPTLAAGDAGIVAFDSTAKEFAVWDGARWIRLKDASYYLDRSNHTGTQLASTISNFETTVRSYPLNILGLPNGSLNLNNQKIINLATPTAASDAANKLYVDNAVAGLNWKRSVKAATTGNITLSGFQTIDGVSIGFNDRVLVKDQSTQSQNGIYVAKSGAWARADDADEWNELVSAAVFVEEGTQNADTAWTCVVNANGVLGTTAVTWTQFTGAGQIVAGAGITKNGNTISVDYDPATIGLNGNKITVKLHTDGNSGLTTDSNNGILINTDNTTIIRLGNVLQIASAYRVRKFTTTITGDGSATTFRVIHNFLSTDVTVSVYDISTKEMVYPLIRYNTVNDVEILFKIAPANGKQYRVVVVG